MTQLREFDQQSSTQVKKILMASPSKSSGSNPIPTTLLKEILPSVIDFIMTIFNHSKKGTCQTTPDSCIKPLLKKANLDLLDKNFRPASNLSFISKPIERCAASNIVTYAEEDNLMEPNQSAYHQHFSTETSVLKVCADILKAMDNCIILLDLSAAFDTIDHDILLRRLEKRFSIKGTVNKWIESYLKINTNVSSLGMFRLYTSSLGDLCRSHVLNYQLFADDQKIYMPFKPRTTGTESQCIISFETCIEDTRSWMNTNLLKLNDDKMEFIILGTRQQLAKVNEISIKVGNAVVKTSAKC